MRWWRGRGRASGADTDLLRCGACGRNVPVDAGGRCLLGHRVATAPARPPGADAVGRAAPVPAPQRHVAGDQEGVSAVPAEPPAAAAAAAAPSGGEALAELLAWDDATPSASALDVDGAALPAAARRPEPAPAQHAVVEPDYDDIDDATHARRRAAGILGGTTIGLLAVLGAVVALPF